MLIEVLDVFERYGMHYRDDQHTGCAIGLLRDAALIYDAQQPSRAAAVGIVLSEEQTQLLAEMCQDALARLATAVETCRESGRLNGALSSRHASALARADAYQSLARYIGAPLM
jgi:hypothetical protein